MEHRMQMERAAQITEGCELIIVSMSEKNLTQSKMSQDSSTFG